MPCRGRKRSLFRAPETNLDSVLNRRGMKPSMTGTISGRIGNDMECSHCHSSNPPAAVRCVQCDTLLNAGEATDIDLPTRGVAETPAPQPEGATLEMSVSSPGGATAEIGIAEGWSQPSAPSPVSVSPLLPRSLLGTRYEILALLGEGGM